MAVFGEPRYVREVRLTFFEADGLFERIEVLPMFFLRREVRSSRIIFWMSVLVYWVSSIELNEAGIFLSSNPPIFTFVRSILLADGIKFSLINIFYFGE